VNRRGLKTGFDAVYGHQRSGVLPAARIKQQAPGAAPTLREAVGYASTAMPATARPTTSDAAPPLPADDPAIFDMDLRGLRRHWAASAALPAISAETMTGADRRAQALGYPELRLMEHAGTAVAAAVRALATDLGRWGTGPIVILCGPGNNGGDGYVAARRLALAGASVIVAVVASEARPRGNSAARNWDRIARDTGIVKVHLPVARDVAMFGQGVGSAAVIVDALLGTGVRGALREPIRSAVEVVGRARAAGVPVVAVDTPTAVDLSSGEPSDPAVLADLTVTFHRPKTGLLTRRGAAHAGKILVAPIGIPAEADRG
jgi:ADP-dependent NAD(P)H-hydrate dehydratase / NAD(P)H-hydrate epimerase